MEIKHLQYRSRLRYSVTGKPFASNDPEKKSQVDSDHRFLTLLGEIEIKNKVYFT